MRVLAMAQGQWYLLEHEGQLYLDVLCRHNNRFMIQLNEREVAEYRRSGNAFLKQQARDIQYAVPIRKGTRCGLQGRDQRRQLGELANTAECEWLAAKEAEQ
ncbi:MULTISPECIES: hypothetical protein [Shewanella]|uniref:Uncharacterized protein n=1 Tax=Shewanella indica TaxID=768528 RepID=A0ABU4QI91_9GAMM|nr:MULTISPECIES: hypothetical protein [Shewanella]MDX6018230.1 hypothetical protein [Shewanella indica]NDO75466.1 hypothetical protein [Shewanella sp. SE1]BCV36975.1 hypothetical protein TUM17377_23030 [Shewanella chilikensis]